MRLGVEAGRAGVPGGPHPEARARQRQQPDHRRGPVTAITRATLAARLRCYLVTDADPDLALLEERCAAALAGGVTTVQLRAKGLTDRQLLLAAQALHARCQAAGALFIVNDRVDIALAAGADGVHLGVDDLPVADARRLLGPHAVIGYSPENDADRLAAEQAGADYLGVGPVYGTSTKSDAGAAIGLDGLARVVRATTLPVVGIGGVTLANAPDVLCAGAAGVAVVGAIWHAPDPEAAARATAARDGTPMSAPAIPRLHLLGPLGVVPSADFPAIAERAVAGGVDAVHVRLPDASARELLALARAVRERCLGARLLVNDRLDIALLAEADGAQLGEASVGVLDARQLLGPNALLGRSVHDLDGARQADADGADFLLAGHVYETPSKAGQPGRGLAWLAELARGRADARHRAGRPARRTASRTCWRQAHGASRSAANC